jgi:hypothetical protein
MLVRKTPGSVSFSKGIEDGRHERHNMFYR